MDQISSEQYNSDLSLNPSQQLAQQSFMYKVFGWMFLGLLVTAGVAAWFATQNDMLNWVSDHPLVYLAVIFGQLGVVIFLIARIQKMSAAVASTMFIFYSGLVGFTFAVLISYYSTTTVAGAFGITAGMFGAMGAYGAITKRDLTSMGSILFMGLIGLIIAMIVNIFWPNGVLYLVISVIGVIIFCGLTAYDMQKIKQIGQQSMTDEQSQKASIVGALALYLDFINLFMFVLRIFGAAR